MRWLCLLSAVLGTCQAIYGSDGPAGVTQPPVLKRAEPTDNVVFQLPGPAPARAAAIAQKAVATEVHLAPPAPDPDRPVLHRAQSENPPDFERDSAYFLNQQIGLWRQTDVQELLGEATRQRAALGDDDKVNGQILAYSDPTGRYRELELDFDQATGLLRTLFVYPNSMTWQECRRSFGVNVRSTQANKGRTFYSYLDRRLDVLVDAAGKVISLGMY